MSKQIRHYPRQQLTQKDDLIFLDAPTQHHTSSRPRLIEVGGSLAPGVSDDLSSLGVPIESLEGLVLKTVHIVPHFTTDWVADQTRLPRVIVSELLDKLMSDRLVEVIGQDGPLSYPSSI